MPFAVDFQGGVSSAWSNVITFLPKLAAALVIILTSLLSSASGGPVMAKGARIAILVFGAFAALDQLQIAPRIVTGLWYAILAIVVGSAVVAIGGGGIKTMQRYWERATTTAEQRAPELKQQAQQSAQASAFDDGDGRRPTPTPQPRTSQPPRPAGYAATARPWRPVRQAPAIQQARSPHA